MNRGALTFPMQSDCAARLEQERRELVDIRTRTRLLNTPRRQSRVKTVEVVDELSQEVFRILVTERRPMTFLATKSSADATDDAEVDLLDFLPQQLPQPGDEESEDEAVAQRHKDTRLQTGLTSERLQKRLLSLYYDARTAEEEQGVNILYLALGFLKWFEADSSDKAYHAPLILIPVNLDRKSARARISVSSSDEELSTNLSLQERLRADFGVDVPELPELEDLSPTAYFAQVANAVGKMPRWEVLENDIVLGMFSFAKFLMFRDLEPGTWPERCTLEEHPLVCGLVGDGFGDESPLFPDDAHVDEIIDPADSVHVLDADSSQTLAIEEVRRGRDLVIQGPPGTGKSQTIANLIAAAVKDGKQVLFVAEKRAALDVVKRRLDDIDLGALCLELHSHKARKKVVLEDLQQTLALGRPRDELGGVVEALKDRRDRLNRHAEQMNGPIGPAGVTPYRIVGELVRLRAKHDAPPDFQLAKAREWTAEQKGERERLVEDLASLAAELGTPGGHVWRGVRVEALLPVDVERLVQRLDAALPALSEWIDACESLGQVLRACPNTAREVGDLLRLANAIRDAPRMDRACLANEVWSERRLEIEAIVADGEAYKDCRNKLSAALLPHAWTMDLGPTRQALAAHGESIWRLFSSEYRSARKTFKAVSVGRPPKGLGARLYLLDTLAKGQAARQRVSEAANLGGAAFGALWKAEDSDWPALREIEKWERATREQDFPVGAREAAASVADVEHLENLTAEVERDYKGILDPCRMTVEQLDMDLVEAFGQKDLIDVPLKALATRLEAWVTAPEAVHRWVTYHNRAVRARQLGLGDLITRLHDGRIAPETLLDVFLLAYYEDLVRHAWEVFPELAAFDGTLHQTTVSAFQELDEQRIELARQEVALAHYSRIPEGGAGVGELGIVRREIAKKRRRLPVRRLLASAGRAIQAIKPVFMMSPMSVAQFLEPGGLDFDLLLIDEASQVKPVDALGSIGRCKQMVVVGDKRQLPPTAFFDRLVADVVDADTEDDHFRVADVESILGLCEARGINSKMLRWHYRSRHESLIAVSNKQFYDSRLFIVPSALSGDELGLRFHYVADGVFDRGGTAVNRKEARAVANAVIEHARDFPSLSLGVGAFSIRQRDAILDELELLRRQNPDLESFFRPTGPEPFFVKNLEAIQGDERDVVFVSVGYGRDSSGFFAMNFGPLSAEGGERRLNVLITRARQRCVAFASVRAADIDLRRGRGSGVAALKTFLQYADTRQLDLAVPSGRDPQSPFEEEVGNALIRHGHSVDFQVGIAGFFIDLAVRNPATPGDYLLGIECDGASYHSSRFARDRDRLRQAVLEDRGWQIHRIWSTDWFRSPDSELRKVLAAIDRASSVARTGFDGEQTNESMSLGSPGEIRREEPAHQGRADQDLEVSDYEEANLSVDSEYAPHEVSLTFLAGVVKEIVEIEGPIHRQEVARRVATVWGLKRCGSRVREATADALDYANRHLGLFRSGDFFADREIDRLEPRNRAQVTSKTLQRPDMLPPSEIRGAVFLVVSNHVGVSVDDVVVQVTRLFGFSRAGGGLREVIEEEVRAMLYDEELRLQNNKLYVRREEE